MELGTFGAVLKFAMDLEEQAVSFYEAAQASLVNSKTREQFTSLMERSQKRLKTLERVRRENTTEMILEPIGGLDQETYTPDTDTSSGLDEKALLSMAISLEKKLQNFYTDASVKVEFLIEAAYALEAMAEDSEEAVEELSSI